MKRIETTYCLLAGLVFCLMASSLYAADPAYFDIAPRKQNGEKWQIAYCTADEDAADRHRKRAHLAEMMRSLAELEWLRFAGMSDAGDDQDLWQELARTDQSPYIRFMPLPYSPPDPPDPPDPPVEGENKIPLRQRLKGRGKPPDCVITMDPEAAARLAARRDLSIPILLLVTAEDADPYRISPPPAGENKRIYRANPFRSDLQIRVFRKFFTFGKLGTMYRDDLIGVGSMADLARREKIEILSCALSREAGAKNRELPDTCFQKLIAELGPDGAIYIADHAGVSAANPSQVIETANRAKIKTFARDSALVANGVLMGIATGRFYAEALIRLLSSISEGQAEAADVTPETPKIVINVRTAKAIGYDPPIEVLGAADRIYETYGKDDAAE
ncbi:hypothetical protein DENIS_3089 [Desulfonema ishimotonii]|uniref:ABC transporter substrate-binding protein n=1 Tax=Desulfonema ishimotonii TaxID=45657 RepID=A0A401FYW0_9BACT|nr:hypothetical protein [Desulfonema ishimotonii]GBC62126.1 hypothetical protein DENIS_3089 [Desulfonema ishimotonii]